jgi:hypothetical protein
MKTVPLGGKKAAGRVAQVDDHKFEVVSQHNWYLWEIDRGPGRRPAGPYPRTNIPKPGGGQATVLMHTLITGWPYVDHEDGNGLNNQMHNLRKADDRLNNQNRKPNLGHNGKPPTSRYKGVSWFKAAPGKGRDRWQAKIRIDGKQRRLGYFDDEVEAAKAYDTAARAAFGEFARPNFPEG